MPATGHCRRTPSARSSVAPKAMPARASGRAEHHDIALGHARQTVPEAAQADGEHAAEQHRPERCPEG